MTITQLIEKKQSGSRLSRDEIEFFIAGYVNGKIPDYQASALLMAIYFKGMDLEETVHLTGCMIESGERVDFSGVGGKVADKHSTGGVGDKLSLLVAPSVSACGVMVPMISGRGLGHTGGTLDKLESIPGFKTEMSPEALRGQTIEIGMAFARQDQRLVPADLKLYALRDVTATVKSFPLIASSIISKKAAEGVKTLVLDAKTGDGAFFQKPQDAEKLAKLLVLVGEEFGIKTVALLTNMDSPLGYAVGNWLEVEECLEILKSGAGAGDIMELYYALTATMLVLSGVVPNLKQATKRAEEVLKNGFSSRKFREVVKAQGGNLSFIDHPENYPPAKFSLPVHASKSGFVHKISARACGDAAMLLGAGRKQIEDRIDYSAGIKFLKKPGQQVSKGDIIAVLYSNLKGKVLQVSKDFPNFIIIGKNPVPKSQMIHKVIKKNSALSWSEFCYSS